MIIRYIKTLAKPYFFNYQKESIIKYYNFLALLTIFHEVSHVWQQNGLEFYSEINRLHFDVLHIKLPLKEIFKIARIQIRLINLYDRAYYERQANIDALRELINIYQESSFLYFIQQQHLYNLSFKPKGLSIVHDTLNACYLDFNYNCDSIPNNLLFEVGLPVDTEYSEIIYSAIDKYYNNELSYRRVIEIMDGF